jgi:molecular chaperone GrpE
LALAHAPREGDSKNFVVGIEMTRKLLLDSLSRHGLSVIGELGEPFDPARHEAVGMEANKDYPEGSVCGLMTRGYRLRDRLLRPARVTVCKL